MSGFFDHYTPAQMRATLDAFHDIATPRDLAIEIHNPVDGVYQVTVREQDGALFAQGLGTTPEAALIDMGLSPETAHELAASYPGPAHG